MGLAQSVRASGCGPEGRGFESHNSPQSETTIFGRKLSFLFAVLSVFEALQEFRTDRMREREKRAMREEAALLRKARIPEKSVCFCRMLQKNSKSSKRKRC